MSQRESNFKIKSENRQAALNAILNLMESKGDMQFDWVSTHKVIKSQTVEAALYHWRWECRYDPSEDIIGITFIGEKIGDDEILFKIIAPFVEEGSYIEMVGEDGIIWRWIFNDSKCIEKVATITF